MSSLRASFPRSLERPARWRLLVQDDVGLASQRPFAEATPRSSDLSRIFRPLGDGPVPDGRDGEVAGDLAINTSRSHYTPYYSGLRSPPPVLWAGVSRCPRSNYTASPHRGSAPTGQAAHSLGQTADRQLLLYRGSVLRKSLRCGCSYSVQSATRQES